MSEWIELNLPYNYNLEKDSIPYPDLSIKMKEHFGITRDEFYTILIECEDYDGDIDLFNQELENRTLLLNKNLTSDCFNCIDFLSKVKEWEEKQPEVIEWHNKLDKLDEAKINLSFCGMGLNKPGVLIEVELNNELHQYLIGDINTGCGICDDCAAFSENTIVKRYKIVWSNSIK